MSQLAICPRCQSPLAADAPEGLCPACLMAGGLASVPSPAAGFAATTPWTDEKRAAAIADLAPHFPQLEIIELLGQGGMGAVYKARQKHLDRLIALKVIPPEAATDPAFAERFAREARALARLNHPNIVTVYDFGQSKGVYFLLMEFVDGLNLRQTMASGNLSPQEALAIVPHICDALQYAHDQGIVHRDVKPENVLLDKTGRVKIADFGLAKLLTQSPMDYTLTHSMQVMGTPRYMAPEQIEHPTEVDHRADIYSLGVMFYEMLTGELPMGRFAPPSQKVQIDIRIDEIVLRSLEKEPAKRYQHASDVKTELETVKSSPRVAPSIHATSAPTAEPVSVTGIQALEEQSTFQAASPQLLGRMLFVAGTIILSLLIIGVGIMVGVLPFVWMLPKHQSLGYFGAAFGCIIGGLGALLGTINGYRQMAGQSDWMETQYRTWLDRAMLAYLLLGIAGMMFGWVMANNVSSEENRRFYSVPMVLGCIVIFQGLLFLLYRATVGKTAVAGSRPTSALSGSNVTSGASLSALKVVDESDVISASKYVSAPGLGLMIAGFLSLVPAVLQVLGLFTFAVMKASLFVSLGQPRDIAGLDFAPILAQEMALQPIATLGPPVWFLIVLLLITVVQILSSLVMILGGQKMRRLDTYGLAVTASIVALLPTGPVWIVSMPIGIWALIVLATPEVRDAFRSKWHRRETKIQTSRPVDVPLPPSSEKSVDEWTVVNVKQQLFWPGLGLAGGGGLGLVGFLVGCLGAGALSMVALVPSNGPSSLGPSPLVYLGMLLVVLQIPWSLLIILAGMKMMRVENYGLSLAGAWIALLPVSPAAIVTMPFGIWALVALSSRETWEAFRQNAAR